MDIAFKLIIILFSIVIHEVAHGWAALAQGDPTAKYAGRLSLNPIKHLDPIGSVLVPIISILVIRMPFGWAKPVPVNPYNFKDHKYGEAKVSFAGPLANIILAVFFGLILRFFPVIWTINGIGNMFIFIVQINLILAIFNLMPIPPLDGSHIFFSFLGNKAKEIKLILSQYGFVFLIFLLFFFFEYIAYAVLWLSKLIIGIPI